MSPHRNGAKFKLDFRLWSDGCRHFGGLQLLSGRRHGVELEIGAAATAGADSFSGRQVSDRRTAGLAPAFLVASPRFDLAFLAADRVHQPGVSVCAQTAPLICD